MSDIFDQIASEYEKETSQKQDIFDRVASEQGDIFDQIAKEYSTEKEGINFLDKIPTPPPAYKQLIGGAEAAGSLGLGMMMWLPSME